MASTPLWHLRRLRVAVLVFPLMGMAVNGIAFMGRGGGSPAIMRTHDQLQRALVPVWLMALAAVLFTRLGVSVGTAQSTRTAAVYVSYLLALVTSFVSGQFWLAGGSPMWAIAGYGFAVATVVLIPLSGYSQDA